MKSTSKVLSVLNSAIQTPSINGNKIDLNVSCSECGVSGSTQSKVLRIEIVSSDKNMFRLRFDPYAASFSDYDVKENRFGPITRAQLDWIQKQDQTRPKIDVDADYNITITLKDIIMTFYASCWMEVRSRADGRAFS